VRGLCFSQVWPKDSEGGTLTGALLGLFHPDFDRCPRKNLQQRHSEELATASHFKSILFRNESFVAIRRVFDEREPKEGPPWLDVGE